MIPVRLVLRDFLSYASPPALEFEGFDVACLSGDNGVGKSALLDAMTWAMFGRARGCESGQNQDRLIRDGAKRPDGTREAVVDFTFDLSGTRYRIVRRRVVTARGESKGDVRFLVGDGEDWRNIAGETLKATDEKIESVLRMDYDTFTASAFFLQGRSEDFLARMSASERKDVFARLLDLGVYEELEDAAKEHARAAERSRQDVAAHIGELESSTSDVAVLERELVVIDEQLALLEREASSADGDLDAARRELQEIEKQQALLDREQQALETTAASVHAAVSQVEAKTAELAEVDALLAREDDVREAVRELEVLRTADEAARAQQQEAAALDRRAAEIDTGIEAARRTITDRLAQRRARIASLERELGPLQDAEMHAQRAAADLAATADPSDALAEARELLEAQQVGGARFGEQASAAETALATATDALGVLKAGGGECPVCGGALDAKHRAEAKARLQTELKTARASAQTAAAGVVTARKEAKRIAEEIRRLEAARTAREQLAASRAELLGRVQRLEPVTAELEAERGAADADHRLLDGDAFAAESVRELAAVRSQATSTYDRTAHERLLARLKELAPAATLLGAIEQAAERRTRVVADLAQAAERLQGLERELGAHRTTIEHLAEAASGAPAAQEHVRTCQTRLVEVRDRIALGAQARAKAEVRLETARQVECELGTARAQEAALAAETRRFRRLAEAFGRAGIPQHVIDNAVPDLIDDANKILGRLSDHEMSVSFQFQRDTRSGKPKDTFDVNVHHEGGVRDFAMFSGGEAFRVAFAVRLAMSKLLVTRAGARLETLVIDEGFGTQDPGGRERLVEAINVARGEFAKILVITHLEDLKDQFGAQIVVSRGPDGSLLQVTRA